MTLLTRTQTRPHGLQKRAMKSAVQISQSFFGEGVMARLTLVTSVVLPSFTIATTRCQIVNQETLKGRMWTRCSITLCGVMELIGTQQRKCIGRCDCSDGGTLTLMTSRNQTGGRFPDFDLDVEEQWFEKRGGPHTLDSLAANLRWIPRFMFMLPRSVAVFPRRLRSA